MNIISEFQKIRDIPYRIPLSTTELDNCCSGKSRMLKLILENYWYSVKYKVCTFKRSNFNLPKDLLETPHLDLSSHVYLGVFIDNKWINIDPTRDRKLKNILHVEEWDWKTNTGIAVKTIDFFDDEKSRKIMEDESIEDIESDLEINWKFYEKFNYRLEINRK